MAKAIDKLIDDIEINEWESPIELKNSRPDADLVHSGGFYFFDISIHRTMILVEFDENKRARIIWAGSHKEYDKVFKNNRRTISKWLKESGWI